MKRTLKPAGILLLVAFAVIIGWRFSRPKIEQMNSTSSSTKLVNPETKANELPPLPAPDDLPKIIQPYARTPMLNLADPRWKEWRRMREVDPVHEWKTPIEFFGKVIDERNLPIAGAEIEYSWNGTAEKYGGDGVEHRIMTSGVNGLFHIHGIEGKGITIRVSKDGYYRRKSWNGGSFEYAGFWEPNFTEPDINSPVIFHLLKRPVAEPTLRVYQRWLPKSPTLQTRIDLLAKSAETAFGGDFVLQITRPPNPGYKNPFDWQLKIEGQNGAEIIMSEEEFMIRAPSDGYQNVIAKDYKQARGSSIETVKFYVRNKVRKLYAAVSVEVTPFYPNHLTKEDAACFIVTGTVNPNDSPNVEYDPEKNIREMAKK